MKLTARRLLKIDRWFYPLSRVVRGRGFSFRRKQSTGKVAVIKLAGMGSIIRLLSICQERKVDFSRVTLITFESNREVCQMFGAEHALFIRTDSVPHFVRDCVGVWLSIRRIKPDMIIDFERCSSAVSLFRYFLAIAGNSRTIGFDEFATVQTRRHSVFNINSFSFQEMLLNGIDRMPKGETEPSPRLDRKESSALVVNINCSEYLLARRYPRDLFQKLIAKLSHRMNRQVVYLTGAVEESDYVEELAASLAKSGVRVHNVAGVWTLTQLQQALRSVKLFVSGDSGPLHLAIHMGVPTIAIWGPTRPQHFGYHDNEVLVNIAQNLPCAPCFAHPGSKPALACKGQVTCLGELSPDSILRTADRILQGSVEVSELVPTTTW